MRITNSAVLCAFALCVLLAGRRDAQAQAQTAPSSVDQNATVDTGFDEIEEIIVRGRDFGDLRFEIRRSEEALFARFNDLNSTDDFDIHCRYEIYGHLRGRSCQSNFFRELQAKTAAAQVRDGRQGLGLAWYYAREVRRLNELLAAEMRQLATEDEQLRGAMAELTDAQLALTLARGKRTLSRQVTAASGSLPYDAELMFEIVMGVRPLRHPLTQPTFTIANVAGEIRELEVECAEGRQRLNYESGVDWTVPSGWSSCALQVNAGRQTTFRLYEF